MLGQSPQLIVIDEYPSPSLPPTKPFLNPICKGTYDALPKIYGRRGKKRYLLNIQDVIKNQHATVSRPCCDHHHRPPSDLEKKFNRNAKARHIHAHIAAIADPKAENCRKKTCPCSGSAEKTGEGSVEDEKSHAKPHRVILPHLADIDEIKQAESRHKVHSGSNPAVQNPRTIAESRFLLLQTRQERLKEIKQVKASRSEYIQTDLPATKSVTEEEEGKVGLRETAPTQQFQSSTSRKQRYQSQHRYDDSKPYYEYLENDPRLKPTADIKQKSSPRQYVRRRANTSEDQNLSISSFTIKNQNSASTIFHQFKKKQSSRNSNLPHLLTTSTPVNKNPSFILPNGCFKVPQPKDYESFLSSYTPMDPSFDLKALIRQPNFHIVPAETYLYFGQVQNQMKHGLGIMISEKELFEGTYDANAKSEGYERNKEGVYSGSFEGGRRCGQGRFVWKNGEEFQGEWREGKKNGRGVWRSPKGDSYEGEWRDNRQNGRGCYVHTGTSKFNGYFKDFLKSGKGEEEFANGDKYVGSYELGKPHGYGKYSWANGDTYEGEFVEGSRQGVGVLRRADGQVYEGEFRNDAKHGQGKEKYKSGEQFVGEFKDGERLKGKLRTKNGTEIVVTSD